ncbi:MAG: fructosamine kinase family protein, partial [Gemmatimonadetes bacterium]|nr:fructosamine kinase family protein [Gemmatimonadota bacterium]
GREGGDGPVRLSAAGIPGGVRRSVEEALGQARGRPSPIAGASSLGGGCINPSARVETGDGDAFFLKWNADAPAGMMAAEADGLEALRAAAALRVPEMLGHGASGGAQWLLLELVPQGRPGPGYAGAMGRGLAALHEAGDGGWGWERDNFIGSLPQANGGEADWTSFWRERRLLPQLRRARDGGHLASARGAVLDRLLDRLDDVLSGAGADGPCLLHGDLWGGNAYPGPEGEPVIIDPAVYRGHGEVDLAMSELFGGFPAGHLEAYQEARGLAPAYRSHRRACYQLYYLLVHVNLFGSGYVGRTLAAAEEALAGA